MHLYDRTPSISMSRSLQAVIGELANEANWKRVCRAEKYPALAILAILLSTINGNSSIVARDMYTSHQYLENGRGRSLRMCCDESVLCLALSSELARESLSKFACAAPVGKLLDRVTTSTWEKSPIRSTLRFGLHSPTKHDRFRLAICLTLH